MKQDTRRCYECVVQKAVDCIASGLDEALDLAELAREAGLSPLHFHRIFRGMVGETPLEFHRRLRLERAAFGLARSNASVTSLAFEAGYETHESFTRSFRDAFGAAPRAYREHARAARSGCAQAASFELAARCGVHFAALTASHHQLRLSSGGTLMNVETETKPALRVATVSHVGPYYRNTPEDAKPEELRTDLYLHLAG